MHRFCFKKQLHCICLARSHSFFLPFGATALETSRPRRIAARTAPEPACQHAPCRELLPPSCWSRLPSLLSKSHPAHCFQPRRELCCCRNHRMPGAPLSAVQAAAPRRSRPQAAHYHALGSAPPTSWEATSWKTRHCQPRHESHCSHHTAGDRSASSQPARHFLARNCCTVWEPAFTVWVPDPSPHALRFPFCFASIYGRTGRIPAHSAFTRGFWVFCIATVSPLFWSHGRPRDRCHL